jgi:hypothetical protein
MTPLFASSTNAHHVSSRLANTPAESLTVKLLDQQIPEDQKHPLHYTWVFWFMHRPPGAKITNYESGMKKIASVSSVSPKAHCVARQHPFIINSTLPETDRRLLGSLQSS